MALLETVETHRRLGSALAKANETIYYDTKPAINALQCLAILFMFSDHIGKYLFPDLFWFQVVGRLGMPLWPFFIAYGYSRSRNVKAYKQRVLLVAIAAQLPYVLATGYNTLNPVFGLYCGLAIISSMSIREGLVWYFVSIILGLFFGMDLFFLHCIMCFHYLKKDLVFIGVIFLITILSYFSHPHQMFSLLGLPIIYYTKEIKFRLPKIIKLGVYPFHYSIFALIKIIGQ